MSDPNPYINPKFVKGELPQYSFEECIKGIAECNYNILAHLISKSESHLKADRHFVSRLLTALPDKGFSRRIAISGAPGVGKSTFINALGKVLLQEGRRIAVLPVDPSSHVSKGSILGDKTRMSDIVNHKAAFIKPMSSSLSFGGVAPATASSCLLCEKAGFDYIFIETVGVGQSEYLVKEIVDCFILLLQPGGGDDLQGIKRGIMEMADILVINKADGELKNKARLSFDSYKNALKLLLPNALGWKASITSFSSTESTGAEDLMEAIDAYFEFLGKGNVLKKMRKAQELNLFDRRSRDIILDHFLSLEGIAELIEGLKLSIEGGMIPAVEALHRLEGIFEAQEND